MTDVAQPEWMKGHTSKGNAAWVKGMKFVKVNLTLDAEVAETARAFGLNMSRLAEAAIAEATKTERNLRWRAENQASLAAYADEVARDGMPLAAFRSF